MENIHAREKKNLFLKVVMNLKNKDALKISALKLKNQRQLMVILLKSCNYLKTFRSLWRYDCCKRQRRRGDARAVAFAKDDKLAR